MADREDTSFAFTAPVVMAHPHLFEARAFKSPSGKDQGDPKFSANFVFDPASEDLKALKALAVKVARSKWPQRDLKELAFPFQNGTANADLAKTKNKNGDYQRGKVVMVARSKYQPRLALLDGGKIIDLADPMAQAAAKPKFYFGAEVYAQVAFSIHEVGSNKPGVNAYLNMVMTTNKGVKLAGGASASEVFKGHIGGVSAEDPTGLSDEVPF